MTPRRRATILMLVTTPIFWGAWTIVMALLEDPGECATVSCNLTVAWLALRDHPGLLLLTGIVLGFFGGHWWPVTLPGREQ